MILDKRDKNGRIVLVAKLGKASSIVMKLILHLNQDKIQLYPLWKTLGNVGTNTQFSDASLIDDIWMQVLLSDPLTQINGMSVIADCTGLSSAILKWLIPKNCRVGATKLESLPLKKYTIHVVNMGPIFKTCIMFIKPFLRRGTIANVHYNRIHFIVKTLNCENSFIIFFRLTFQFEFHNDGYTNLIDSLGEECLPSEYGGKNGPIDYEKSLKFILSHEKLLSKNREFGYKKWTTADNHLL